MSVKNKVKKGKGLSKLKKKSISKNKMCKSGLLAKEKSKLKRKERRAEKRKTSFESRKASLAKQESGIDNELELTGEDMLQMIDKEDLDSLMAPYRKMRDSEADQNIVPSDSRVKKLLPIKGVDGWIKQQIVVPKSLKKAPGLDQYKRKVKEVRKDADVDSGMELENDDEKIDAFLKSMEEKDKEVGTKSVSEILAHRHRALQAKKISIGCIAMNIIEDPTKLLNLKFLLSMMKEEDPSVAITVRKYTSLTILHVMHSIIPSYKIQESNINKNKMKKDTFQVAQQEKNLLSLYKHYLTTLEEFLEILNGDPENIGYRSVCQTALKCLGELVAQHPHFNYTLNILQLIIPFLNHTAEELRQTTFDALKRVVKSDKVGYLTLDIVKRVNKLVRTHKFHVKPLVLELFLHIRVNDMKNADEEKDNSRKNVREATHRDKLLRKLTREAMAKPSRKQKKERKKMAKLREEKASIEAGELMKVVNRKHTDIISIVFSIYFHILKNKPLSKLIGVVLEGLAKFAHLINIEFFSDLLALLSDFLAKGALSQSENLHCIQAVFTILYGQGEALTVDAHRFYKHLYSKTFDLKIGDQKSEILVYLDLIESIIIQRRKKISPTKVLAFTKRLATLILSILHQEAVPSMVILRSLLVTFSCTEALLDPNEDGCAGIFNPEVDEPEHSYPSATALWELHSLVHHYHPIIRDLSKNILEGTAFKDGSSLVALTKRSPFDLYNDYDLSSLKFKPSIPMPSAHIKAHQNFIASKKRKQGDTDELMFDDFELQMKCEKVYEQIMECGESDFGYQNMDIFGSLVQNIL